MIALLTGTVARVAEDSCIIQAAGVGYLVFASRSTLSRLPSVGEEVSLEIETNVREDHIHLYGFYDEAEKAWFSLITTVQGVGAKVGLAILGVLPPSELGRALAAGDKVAITRAPGVGPKLAQRMISELKDKVGDLATATGTDQGVSAMVAAEGLDTSLNSDVVSALTNLGYSQANAAITVAQLASQNPSMDFDDLFRSALMEMAG